MTSTKNYTPEADRLTLLFAGTDYNPDELVTFWAGNFRRLERELREQIESLQDTLHEALEDQNKCRAHIYAAENALFAARKAIPEDEPTDEPPEPTDEGPARDYVFVNRQVRL